MDENSQSSGKVNFLLIFAFVGFLLFDLVVLGIYFKKKKGLKVVQEKQKEAGEQLQLGESRLINTSDYKEYLDKYPENAKSFTENFFTLFGKIEEIFDDYLVLEIGGNKIRVDYFPEAALIESGKKEDVTLPFKPSMLDKGTMETLVVKKDVDNKLLLVAVQRIKPEDKENEKENSNNN